MKYIQFFYSFYVVCLKMDPLSLLLFVILIFLSMFFSASETAFTSVPMHKASVFLKEKKSWAKSLYKLKLKPERVLIAILIWNNIVNIFAASLATVIAMDIAAKVQFDQTLVVSIATAVVTILVLLFWEIFPKTLATRHAERISLSIAPIYTVLIKVLFPLIFVLERMMKGLTKKERKNLISESDLEAFIELSKKAGVFTDWEDQKIKKLLTLDELTAEEIMTPRIKIKSIDDQCSLDDAIEKLSGYHYSRIPVYHESIDTIDRIVTLKELLRLKKEYSWSTLLSQLTLNPIIKVPRSQPIDSLLQKFQKTHKHIAVVLDEYGGVDGIVSLEDIIEEVFWEIQDESDEELTPIKRNEDWTLICQSYVRMDELLNVLGLHPDEIELDDEYEAETLSYFITSSFERFPSSWEKISLDIHLHDDLENKTHSTLEFKVLWVKRNVIWEVQVVVKNQEVEQEK